MIEMLLILFISYFAIGWFCSFILLDRRKTCLSERIVFSVAFNIAFIAASMHIMGTVGNFKYDYIAYGGLIAIIVSIAIKSSDIKIVLQKATLPKLKLWQMAIVGYVLFQLLFSVYHSMFFPVEGGDPVSYHIPFAILFWQQNTIINGVGHLECCNAFPHAIHLLNTWMFNANGDFDETFVRALSPIMLAILTLLTFNTLYTIEDKDAAYIGMLLLYTVPLMIAHGQSAYINLPDVLFVSLGLYYLFKGLESQNYLFWAGAFGGFGMLVKPSALIFFMIACPIMILDVKRISLKGWLYFIIGSLLFLGPIWYMRNMMIWGTPFYPYFPTGESAPYALSVLKFIFLYFFDEEININWGHGPLLLSFGIIGLMFVKRCGFSKEEKFMLMWLILGIISTAIFLKNGRHMLHTIIPQVYFASKGVLWLLSRNDWIKKVSIACIIFFSLPTFALGAYGLKNIQILDDGLKFFIPLPPENRNEFLRQQWGEIYDAFEFSHATPSETRFFTNQPDWYLMERELFIPRNFKLESVGDGVGELKAINVSYVYHNTMLPIDPKGIALFNSLNDTNYFTLVFENNIIKIYKIK